MGEMKQLKYNFEDSKLFLMKLSANWYLKLRELFIRRHFVFREVKRHRKRAGFEERCEQATSNNLYSLRFRSLRFVSFNG